MTQDDYSDFVKALMKEMGSPTLNILHAAVGIAGEAGELLDAVKKHWAYEKPLDRENVIEELGDLEFYTQALRNEIGVPRAHIIKHNIDKLSVRYATLKYSNEQASTRADKAPLRTPVMDIVKCPVCGHMNLDQKTCYNCLEPLPTPLNKRTHVG